MEIDQNIRFGESHFEGRKRAAFNHPRLFIEYSLLSLNEFLLIPLLSPRLEHVPIQMMDRNRESLSKPGSESGFSAAGQADQSKFLRMRFLHGLKSIFEVQGIC